MLVSLIVNLITPVVLLMIRTNYEYLPIENT